VAEYATARPKANRPMGRDNRCQMVDDPEEEARKILLA
jgi:hypothetical protein